MADKITKLSQAIRLGATIRPQCFGQTFAICDGVMKSCAIGAAIEAIKPEYVCDGLDNESAVGFLAERFNVPESIVGKAHELNDGVYGFDGPQSRETVADWLETQGY